MYSRRRTVRRPRMSYRRPRGTLRRQAFGNFAAAMQQRDSTNIVASLQETVTLNIPVNCNEATLVRNANSLLVTSQYFRNYMGMYDQYKINAIRASVEVLALNTMVSSPNNFPSVCTAWDRNGAQIKSVQLYDKSGAAIADTFTYSMPSYSDVTSYSSANEKTIYYGARWGVIRQLDAASMQEKSMYIPTTQTKDVLSYGNIYSAWNPCLLLALKTNNTPTDTPYSGNVFTIHWQFDITLRGLRKVNTTDSTISLFKPFDGFVGYATTNAGYGVPFTTDSNKYSAASTDYTTISKPTINPSITYNGSNDYTNNSISMPNTGFAEDNKNLAV